MRIIEYTNDLDLDHVLQRDLESSERIRESVLEIIDRVREGGDTALVDLTRIYDEADLTSLRVTEEEIQEALEEVGEDLISVYSEAADNIRKFHEHQLEESWAFTPGDGIILGQKITPLERIGMYVPGGKAAYPSTVLMDSIPAQVAGVEEIVMTTPPNSEGKIDAHILAAAHIAGIHEIYKIGGAQAIAALAYGTESIPPVYKIVGPGNIFVATAKKEVFGKVDIDMIAGPSEVLIIADDTANPEYVAADLLAQAEHDEMAMPILITPVKELAEKVIECVDKQIEDDISRKEIARSSIKDYGLIFIVKSLEEAVKLSNQIAPEHLELHVKNPEALTEKIRNAGAIFRGYYTPEPVGDYFAGPNHTLPTSGTAKFSSPLGVYDFQKRSSILEYSKPALEKIGERVMTFAKSEGLDAHANSINQRLKNE